MKIIQKLIAVVFVGLFFNLPAKAAIDPFTRLSESFLSDGHTHIQPYVRGSRHSRNKPRNGYSVLASFYGHGERLSRYTASGQVFRPNGLTAAHRSLPLGSRLLVSHRGRSVIVTINDRGPAAYTGRSLDLSYGAAKQIGLTKSGVGSVSIVRLN